MQSQIKLERSELLPSCLYLEYRYTIWHSSQAFGVIMHQNAFGHHAAAAYSAGVYRLRHWDGKGEIQREEEKKAWKGEGKSKREERLRERREARAAYTHITFDMV